MLGLAWNDVSSRHSPRRRPFSVFLALSSLSSLVVSRHFSYSSLSVVTLLQLTLVPSRDNRECCEDSFPFSWALLASSCARESLLSMADISMIAQGLGFLSHSLP